MTRSLLVSAPGLWRETGDVLPDGVGGNKLRGARRCENRKSGRTCGSRTDGVSGMNDTRLHRDTMVLRTWKLYEHPPAVVSEPSQHYENWAVPMRLGRSQGSDYGAHGVSCSVGHRSVFWSNRFLAGQYANGYGTSVRECMLGPCDYIRECAATIHNTKSNIISGRPLDETLTRPWRSQWGPGDAGTKYPCTKLEF